MLKKPIIHEPRGPQGLADKEIRAGLEKAKEEWLSQKKEPEPPGEWKGHTQKTGPAEYMEISFDKYNWDIETYMDGTSERNSRYMAIAAAGDDVILMRRVSAREGWPHVLIRDVEIDLDRFPYLTLKQNKKDSAFALRVIDKETGIVICPEDTSYETDKYRAYNLRDLFKTKGKRTFDIKFYYLASGPWQAKDMIFTEPGGYAVLDFIRAESE